MTAAEELDPPRYSPQAHMILALLHGHEYHSGRGLVHRANALRQARGDINERVSAEVIEQVRTGIEALLLNDRIDPVIADEFSELCDRRLDVLKPLGSPLDVGPTSRRGIGPAIQPHDPTPVRFVPANTPLPVARPGTRWAASLGQVDPADMGEVR